MIDRAVLPTLTATCCCSGPLCCLPDLSSLCFCLCVFVCVCMCVSLCVCMCVCVFVCVCACIYVCLFVLTVTWLHRGLAKKQSIALVHYGQILKHVCHGEGIEQAFPFLQVPFNVRQGIYTAHRFEKEHQPPNAPPPSAFWRWPAHGQRGQTPRHAAHGPNPAHICITLGCF